MNNQAYHGDLELLIFCEAVPFFIRNMSAHFDSANGKNGFDVKASRVFTLREIYRRRS